MPERGHLCFREEGVGMGRRDRAKAKSGSGWSCAEGGGYYMLSYINKINQVFNPNVHLFSI